jgi:hypothetical protein
MSHLTMILASPHPAVLNAAQIQHRPAAARTTAQPGGISNPLWIIVIGMACFFGAAALILTWG